MVIYEFLRNSPAPHSACWSRELSYYRLRRNHILVIAMHLFGSRIHANYWLHQKAFGLNHLVPCSLLSSSHGYLMVRDLLARVEYGFTADDYPVSGRPIRRHAWSVFVMGKA